MAEVTDIRDRRRERKKQEEASAPTDSQFEKIEQQNREKKERQEKERAQKNKQVLRSYRIRTPDNNKK